jgi:hypothetical protein
VGVLQQVKVPVYVPDCVSHDLGSPTLFSVVEVPHFPARTQAAQPAAPIPMREGRMICGSERTAVDQTATPTSPKIDGMLEQT